MVYYRPHRGSLPDAMRESKEFESTEDMLNYICDKHNSFVDWFQITPEEIYIKEYGDDYRVGWENCFICCFERPSKIKNIDGYKRYFACTDEDDWMKEDYPVGVIGMFSTNYDKSIIQQYMKHIKAEF